MLAYILIGLLVFMLIVRYFPGFYLANDRCIYTSSDNKINIDYKPLVYVLLWPLIIIHAILNKLK